MKKQKKATVKTEGRLTDEAELLDRYLSQYKYCVVRKHVLERRRLEIMREFDDPLGSVNLRSVPGGGGSGVGCAALSFRLDEINTRIREQMETMTKILTDIMYVIDFLPDADEKSVIESRYIDRLGWDQVCQENHISRTQAIRCWKRGLYALLEFKKVQKIVKEYGENVEKSV